MASSLSSATHVMLRHVSNPARWPTPLTASPAAMDGVHLARVKPAMDRSAVRSTCCAHHDAAQAAVLASRAWSIYRIDCPMAFHCDLGTVRCATSTARAHFQVAHTRCPRISRSALLQLTPNPAHQVTSLWAHGRSINRKRFHQPLVTLLCTEASARPPALPAPPS